MDQRPSRLPNSSLEQLPCPERMPPTHRGQVEVHDFDALSTLGHARLKPSDCFFECCHFGLSGLPLMQSCYKRPMAALLPASSRKYSSTDHVRFARALRTSGVADKTREGAEPCKSAEPETVVEDRLARCSASTSFWECDACTGPVPGLAATICYVTRGFRLRNSERNF